MKECKSDSVNASTTIKTKEKQHEEHFRTLHYAGKIFKTKCRIEMFATLLM